MQSLNLIDMKIFLFLFVMIVFLPLKLTGTENGQPVCFFPEQEAQNINPDTYLKITFAEAPVLGSKGIIRIYEASEGRLVDSLDISIPSGPTKPDSIRKANAVYTPVPYKYETTDFTNANTKPGTPSGMAIRDTGNYQLTIIGRFTDGFHFYPVIVRKNTAVIYPHHNLLEYGKEYYITIDKDVFPGFEGIYSKEWKFQTKADPPADSQHKFVVCADGSGDFNTLQGCMDFIPDFSDEKWEVFIKNGNYEELVYFRNKCNVTIKGESREGVIIHYANNETFNPHPVNLKTNEWPGTFPSRRAAFAADNCYDLCFEDLTIMTTLKGQAEGLLIMGERNRLINVHIIGSGDALQANGSVYLQECIIDGDGDTILGRGPCYFYNCTLSSYGPFMWIRNTASNHGNVFVNCTFLGKGNDAVIARSPVNKGTGYPYAEAVLLNCKLDNILPVGWGTVGGDTTNLHFWEYNSTDLNGEPVDISQRHPLSQQLTFEKDKETINRYSDPEFVLGWKPVR